MRDIILEHWSRYPGMQPEDGVKLLYQSEFGGGHMIPDPCKSLERLVQEQESLGERAAGADGRLVEESFSFGLMLFAIGLCLTLGYLLMVFISQ